MPSGLGCKESGIIDFFSRLPPSTCIVEIQALNGIWCLLWSKWHTLQAFKASNTTVLISVTMSDQQTLRYDMTPKPQVLHPFSLRWIIFTSWIHSQIWNHIAEGSGWCFGHLVIVFKKGQAAVHKVHPGVQSCICLQLLISGLNCRCIPAQAHDMLSFEVKHAHQALASSWSRNKELGLYSYRELYKLKDVWYQLDLSHLPQGSDIAGLMAYLEGWWYATEGASTLRSPRGKIPTKATWVAGACCKISSTEATQPAPIFVLTASNSWSWKRM